MTDHDPLQYPGVMVSSTFTDLKVHREELKEILDKYQVKPIVMEDVTARADKNLIQSSLEMVRDSAAYILIISHRYGQIPLCPKRNPDQLSITELEFNEAKRLGRPILLFIMGEEHQLIKADIETDPVKEEKLEAFKNRAKYWGQTQLVERIYTVFNNLEDFKEQAGPSVSQLCALLSSDAPSKPGNTVSFGYHNIPMAPRLYAYHGYMGSHDFIGRQEDLRRLDEWAQDSDSYSLLLFEAMGGTGKSILTWTWLNDHSGEVRKDWAGRFWYSFYEQNASTQDFLRHALAYMAPGVYQQAQKEKWEATKLLSFFMHLLKERPWLLVLDGIERLLVGYHRFDPASVLDEEAGFEDPVADRQPTDMVSAFDSDLFRQLSHVAPSKILVTSRLMPRCLLNHSNQPRPGVIRQPLPGLRRKDAELLIRNCGIEGSSSEIQRYLKSNCDCHPLVIGVLAGLINRHPEARGDFDTWVQAPDGGQALQMSQLNLVQRSNHILLAAIHNLSESSYLLLAQIALLVTGCNYRTIVRILNPPPADDSAATDLAHGEQSGHPGKPETLDVANAVLDLEERGFLLFDKQRKFYDLHPVVRALVRSKLSDPDRQQLGANAVDYFSAQASKNLDDAETLEDVQPALNLVYSYLNMGDLQSAWDTYDNTLNITLGLNLEAYEERLDILRPFFQGGFIGLKPNAPSPKNSIILNRAGTALSGMNMHAESIRCHTNSLHNELDAEEWFDAGIAMTCLAIEYRKLRKLYWSKKALDYAMTFSHALYHAELLFYAHLDGMQLAIILGDQAEAERHWNALDPLGRNWGINRYRPGEAELLHLECRLQFSTLDETDFAAVKSIVMDNKARYFKRRFFRLKGQWLLKQGQYTAAAYQFDKAAQWAREAGFRDAEAETYLALAQYQTGDLLYPEDEAWRLAGEKERAELPLALLWEMLGDKQCAMKQARIAYTQACADGEPYVHRQELNEAAALIQRLGGVVPACKSHDPGQAKEPEWFKRIETVIETLQAGNEEAIAAFKDLSPEEKLELAYKFYTVDGKDSTGREAWYFLRVPFSKNKVFNENLKNPRIELTDYGVILESAYGKLPDSETITSFDQKYSKLEHEETLAYLKKRFQDGNHD